MSNVAILKAMARNYDGRKQQWDHLDTEACVKAANEIEQLQARVALISQERNGYMEAADRACDERDEFKAKVAELKEENAKLIREVVKRNQLALDGDKAVKAADALYEQLATAEQRVAEACALQVATEIKFHWLDAARVAKEIRSGEWRKHMKGD